MKHLFCILAIQFAVVMNAQQKVEISASYGTSSFFGIAESLTNDIFSTLLLADNDYNSKGTFAADVMLQSAGGKWKYGGMVNVEKIESEKSSSTSTFTSILASANYNWLNANSKFKLYSGAGAGILFYNSTSDDVREGSTFAFNITPIAIRYGGEFGVFLESNIGARGFLQGGISYIF